MSNKAHAAHSELLPLEAVTVNVRITFQSGNLGEKLRVFSMSWKGSVGHNCNYTKDIFSKLGNFCSKDTGLLL